MIPRTLLVPFVALSFAACGGEPETPPDPAAPRTAAAGGDHDDGHALGELRVGGHTMQIVQYGAVAPGELLALDFVFPEGARLPDVARAWIGVESAIGARKERLHPEGKNTLHGHPTVAKQLPEGARLWVEIEEGGTTSRAAIAYR